MLVSDPDLADRNPGHLAGGHGVRGHSPAAVRHRAKVLFLDGVGCLLVGAQMPWSRLGVEAVVELDGGGSSVVVGHGRQHRIAPSAAMLNSSFVQAFELDDYFPAAPWHANAIVLGPALAVVQQREVTGAGPAARPGPRVRGRRARRPRVCTARRS